MDLNDGGESNGDFGSVTDLIGGDLGAGDAGGGDAGDGGGDGAGDGGDPNVNDGGAVPDWYQQLSADTADEESASNLDYVRAKGFKDIDGLVKAYRHAEKGLHESGRIKIPGEGATQQEVAEYRQAIGVPDKPDGYARPEIKGADGSPVPFNTEMTDRIFEKMHELGVPKEIGETLIAAEIEKQVAEHDAAIQKIEQQAGEHVKAWGEDRDAKLAQVNAALKDLGFSREDVMHMRAMPGGVGKFLDAMAKVGTNFTEDSLVKGDRRSFGMDAQQAQSELNAMKTDKAVMDKIMVPGSPERQRYDRLLNIVAESSMAA